MRNHSRWKRPAEIDPVYLNLAKAVLSGRDGVPDEAELVEAHSCVFRGRRFGHLVFKSHGRIISLLVTDVLARAVM